MAKNTARPAHGIEKRGGYIGGKPAAKVGPPAPIPSGTIKPTTAKSPKSVS